jgi:hypothetical protein
MPIILAILGLLALLWFFGAVLLAQKKQWVVLGLLVAGTLGGLAFMFSPVCIPIENGEQEAAQYHYSERQDKDFYVKVFQEQNGQWHHCKTWISRQFFF